jgi:hypothetical protein
MVININNYSNCFDVNLNILQSNIFMTSEDILIFISHLALFFYVIKKKTKRQWLKQHSNAPSLT